MEECLDVLRGRKMRCAQLSVVRKRIARQRFAWKEHETSDACVDEQQASDAEHFVARIKDVVEETKQIDWKTKLSTTLKDILMLWEDRKRKMLCG